jgi:phospholipid/cholesterol/gamma-HCH transport system substrate-binding protein
MAYPKRRNTDILLGAFVCFGVLLLALFIFLIGKENRLFDRSAHVDTYFKNVAGLSVGADVMLAGVLVGYVDEIGFPSFKDRNETTAGKIKVVLRIPQDKLPWLRTDSVARIDGKGLLGDKIINISLGSPKAKPVPDHGELASAESLDFTDALAKAQNVLTHVTGAVEAARSFIESFVSKGGDSALANAAHSIQNVAQAIETGPGLAHRLIYSKESGDNFEETLAGLDKLFKNAETGPSLIHSLAYDPKGAEIVTNLNDIITDTKEGQGTIGRLLNDPSVYDDLKLILGNVERNRILKTLIRFSLSQKEMRQDAKQ